MKIHALPTAFLAVAAVTACTLGAPTPEPEALGQTAQPLCGVPIDVERSLMIHRSDVANESATILDAFPFQAVLSAIVASSGDTTTTTPTRLYREWMSVAEQAGAQGATGKIHCDDASVDPNDWGYECPRDGDAALADVDPFTPANRFIPVALVNRLDLAPSSLTDCGEYRIVFGLNPKNGPGRFFFIFEAKLPNPGGAGSLAGCKAVAEHWQKLSAPTMTVAERTAALRAFYFDGIPLAIPGQGTVTTTPVFSWQNYAGKLGQIRTNQFVQFPWTLREFKLARSCANNACTLRATPGVVKTNLADDPWVDPANPLHANAVSAVQANLTTSRLLSPTAAGIAAKIPASLDSWESRDDAAIDYSAITPKAVKGEITMPPGTLNKQNALDRLTTQTCMGCHNHSSGKDLGDKLFWPASLGFVHVDEQGAISPALTDVFLPARAAFMKSVVEAGCAGAQAGPLVFKDDDAVN